MEPNLRAADVAPDDFPLLVLAWISRWMGNGWHRPTGELAVL